MQTTLREILKWDPCEDGWNKLLATLDKVESDAEPLSFETIYESNGLDDMIWAMRTLLGKSRKDNQKLFRALAVDIIKASLRDASGVASALDTITAYCVGEADEQAFKDAKKDIEVYMKSGADAYDMEVPLVYAIRYPAYWAFMWVSNEVGCVPINDKNMREMTREEVYSIIIKRLSSWTE